jgi:hypothetical protein
VLNSIEVIMQRIKFIFLIILVSACNHPSNNVDAGRIIDTHFFIGDGIGKYSDLNKPEIISANDPCYGAAGSTLPPMTLDVLPSLLNSVMLRPFCVFDRVPSEKYRNCHTTFVRNYNNIHVDQNDASVENVDKNNLCWAASIQIFRRALGLNDVRFDNIYRDFGSMCGGVNQNRSTASVYQTAVMLLMSFKIYDKMSADVYLCSSANCILASILRGYPVIMMKGYHATVIVGADYVQDKNKSGAFTYSFYELDPAENGLKHKSIFEIADADAFITLKIR